MKTLIVTAAYKMTEKDNYIGGCDPASMREWKIQPSRTRYDNYEQIAKEFDLDTNPSDWNVYDGRLEYTRLECEDETIATENEKELWVKGKFTLYNTIYTFYVYLVEETLKEALENFTGIKEK